MNYLPILGRIATQLLLATFLFSTIHAQDVGGIDASNRHISGVIMNQKGEPLTWVTVAVKGTKLATMTNDFSKFSLMIPKGEIVLDISHVGY